MSVVSASGVCGFSGVCGDCLLCLHIVSLVSLVSVVSLVSLVSAESVALVVRGVPGVCGVTLVFLFLCLRCIIQAFFFYSGVYERVSAGRVSYSFDVGGGTPKGGWAPERGDNPKGGVAALPTTFAGRQETDRACKALRHKYQSTTAYCTEGLAL